MPTEARQTASTREANSVQEKVMQMEWSMATDP